MNMKELARLIASIKSEQERVAETINKEDHLSKEDKEDLIEYETISSDEAKALIKYIMECE